MTDSRDTNKPPFSYLDAGVDIEAGNKLIEKIKPFASATQTPGVVAGLGGFGGLFELNNSRYRNPILVSGTDGVGTKLRLAIESGIHDTIGIDLVAMCVNDIAVMGAEPLFFLDYFATGHLDIDVATDVISGISMGCVEAGAALIGGETAEMPGMYMAEDYDLAGFCVGIVEKDQIIDGSLVQEGDILLGLGSSGPHANGYSLIRKVLSRSREQIISGSKQTELGRQLLAPTKIYVKSLLALQKKITIHALSHITGGGLLENIPRVLPPKLNAVISSSAWPQPKIFEWLQDEGKIVKDEMFRTFNCGIGMVICVASADVSRATKILENAGEHVYEIGHIEKSKDMHSSVIIN